jgi:very-short-patch-repair endonuclease
LFAKSNRTHPSKPEAILWRWLRDRKMNDLKFRRQHSIGPYIVDFYCHDLNLIVELDGWSHDDTIQYDQVREKYLLNQGYHTHHINIDYFLHHPEDVIREIEGLVEDLAGKKPGKLSLDYFFVHNPTQPSHPNGRSGRVFSSLARAGAMKEGIAIQTAARR